AERNGRTFRQEIEHACRRHLAAPPVVTISTPALPAAEVAPIAPRPRPRKTSSDSGLSAHQDPPDAPGAHDSPQPASAHQDEPTGRTGGRKGRSGKRKVE